MLKGSNPLMTLAAIVIAIAGMRAASSILIPFLLSIFIAVIGSKPLFWLKGKGIPTIVAIMIVIGLVLFFGFFILLIIGTSLNDFSRTLPVYEKNLTEKTRFIFSWLEVKGINIPKQGILDAFDPGIAMKFVASILIGLKGVLTNGFLIILTTIFILLEASSFSHKLRVLLPDPDTSLAYFNKFINNVQRYMAIKTLTSIGTGIAISIWLLLIGVDYPLLWGLLAFLLNYVPTIGSIIAAVPAVFLSLVQLGLEDVLLVVIGYLVVNIVIGSIIEPRIMGHGLGLSTLVVFLSLVFWGWVFGPVGMLLSVPLTMTLKIAMDSNEDTRWISVLLGPTEDARIVSRIQKEEKKRV